MKKFLLLAFLAQQLACAQIGLEHDFYNGVASRIVLENSGEKYYLFDKQNNKIQFYNADYSFWKSVPVAIPANTYALQITHVSETKINPDAHVEISYTTWAYPSSQSPQSNIINDTGAVLLTVDFCSSIKVDEKEGLPVKIIFSNGSSNAVYAVPGFLYEHGFTSPVTRVKLENSGEKYYTLDIENSLVTIYNADFTPWKIISLTKPDGYSITAVNLLSEHQLNDDDLVEVGYSYHNAAATPTTETRIINENSAILLSLPGVSSVRIDAIDGLFNKLFADASTSGGLAFDYATQVYSVPGLTLEHTYPGIAARTKLENSGEKFYIERYNPETSQIVVYNSDHTPWKTVGVPIQSASETIDGVQLSETHIDPDEALELINTLSSNTLDGGHYTTNVVKEDGAVLLSIQEASHAQLSVLPNLPYKLIAQIQSGPFDNQVYFSRIYGADGVFAVTAFDQSPISVYPNPVKSVLNITSKNPIAEVAIYDLRGSLVQQYKSANIATITLEELAAGLYLVKLTDTDQQQSTHKIVVSK